MFTIKASHFRRVKISNKMISSCQAQSFTHNPISTICNFVWLKMKNLKQTKSSISWNSKKEFVIQIFGRLLKKHLCDVHTLPNTFVQKTQSLVTKILNLQKCWNFEFPPSAQSLHSKWCKFDIWLKWKWAIKKKKCWTNEDWIDAKYLCFLILNLMALL